jgi:hypothetical protein
LAKALSELGVRSISAGANLVRTVAAEAVGDAMRIRFLIALLREVNGHGIYTALKSAGAGTAAGVVQSSLIAQLVLLVTRAYSDARPDDRHAQFAFVLLKHSGIKANVAAWAASGKLTALIQSWNRLRADSRLPTIRHFRDKEVAHSGLRDRLLGMS